MSGLPGLFSCTGRSGYSSYMHMVTYQTFLGKRQKSKLYGSCKASRICNVMCLANLLTGTLAKTIDECPAGIITVKSEVVAKVNHSALRWNIVSVKKLP